MDNHIIAQQAHARTAFHAAFCDLTARNFTKLGDVEHFEDFSVADKALTAFWRKHTFKRAFNLIQQFINNRVITNFDAFTLGQIFGLAVGPYVKG